MLNGLAIKAEGASTASPHYRPKKIDAGGGNCYKDWANFSEKRIIIW